MGKLGCLHWLELPGGHIVMECQRNRDHSGKHWDELHDAQSVGPKRNGGAARKRASVRIEWSR